MKKIVALGGSTSKNSINRALAAYAAGQVAGVMVEVLDLNDYPLPLYSIDLEKEGGIPGAVHALDAVLASADGLVISLAEHNGSYTAAFKNAYDWLSRLDKKVWKDKPMLLMATSPGKRGGASVLAIAEKSFPFLGGNIVATFSLPAFHQHFAEEGIRDEDLKQRFGKTVAQFERALSQL